jgi:hypothetical protein
VGFAQKENVGIGTTKPDQSAILDLSSTNKGLLMPRVTLQQRSSIQNPANGLIVYQTDMISGFYYYDGKEWKAVGTETTQNSVADAYNWGLTGNSGTTGSNFIGTTDNVAIRFKVNNAPSGRIEPGQNTFIGYYSGATATGGNNTGFGYNTLYQSSGNNNTAFGSEALTLNTTGYDNIAVGTAALRVNSTGIENFGLGAFSLFTNTTGSANIAIGRRALYTNNGSTNIAIGTQALESLSSGTGNIALGYQAAQAETGSNKLYVANSNTTTPLIYGDFSTKYLAVGEVAAADRAAATSGGYRLLVKGGMITEKIKVAVAGSADWADYVFEPSYKLMPLEKVEFFIKTNKHLPNVPSAEDMSKNGLDVTQTTSKLMEKIEELTLYIIEMDKAIKLLKEEKLK